MMVITADTTFEGHEEEVATPKRAVIIDDSSKDPEKRATLKAISHALKEKFSADDDLKEFTLELLPDDRGVFVTLPQTKETIDPCASIEKVQRALTEISRAYEADEKPLGPIKEPSLKVRINPKFEEDRRREEAFNEAMAPHVTRDGEPLEPRTPDEWRERMRKTDVIDTILSFARTSFPPGTQVSEENHKAFVKAVNRAFGKEI
jgi:hypothetical protein